MGALGGLHSFFSFTGYLFPKLDCVSSDVDINGDITMGILFPLAKGALISQRSSKLIQANSLIRLFQQLLLLV